MLFHRLFAISNGICLNVVGKSFRMAGTSADGSLELPDIDWKNAGSIYDFSAYTLGGELVSFEKYRGKVALVVNVASQCGLTATNYKELNELYDQYRVAGLNIIAFPCNQFGNQEPQCGVDLEEFFKKKKVQFDYYDKIKVNGDEAHPLYKYMKSKLGGLTGSFIKWNFSKFLINKEGQPVKRYAPTVNPSEIEKDIIEML